MRKVVKTLAPIQETSLESVHWEKYYGVETNLKIGKGFITREKYMEGDYIVLSRHLITASNGWSYLYSPSLKALINTCIIERFSVYEFDTPQELFKWLSE
jgi:hypothetical protein